MDNFSHYSKDGLPEMVDISGKDVSSRSARASGFLKMKKETIELIEKRLLPKGDPFEIAKIAGIMGAKRTSDLIPLCHPLLLSYVNVEISIDHGKNGVAVSSEVRLMGKTGAEMEALTAVSIAALTIYDMCKSVDKTVEIGEIRLVEKTGGKSGHFVNK